MKIVKGHEKREADALMIAFHREEKGDLEGSIKAFKAASRLGSTDARSKLGTIFDDVISPPSPRKAVYWYKKGVEAGDSGCAWNLAMHHCGLGNKRWYRYWLQVALRMGDPDAPDELKTGKWWQKRNAR
ncbi:MAG: hypothetical protein ABIQ32_11525 [Sphingomicrobium sp.]